MSSDTQRARVQRAVAGWSALEAKPAQDRAAADPKAYHEVFGTPAGQAVLADLVALSRLTAGVKPDESDATLRHVEGARAVVNHILGQMHRAERGE